MKKKDVCRLTHTELYCCECNDVVTAVKRFGRTIYPHRPDLSRKVFWRCRNCHNYVGSKKGGFPLGTIPTPEIRRWRGVLHGMMDQYWESRNQRSRVYEMISLLVGKQYHNAEVSSRDDYNTAVNAIETVVKFIEETGSFDPKRFKIEYLKKI